MLGNKIYLEALSRVGSKRKGKNECPMYQGTSQDNNDYHDNYEHRRTSDTWKKRKKKKE